MLSRPQCSDISILERVVSEVLTKSPIPRETSSLNFNCHEHWSVKLLQVAFQMLPDQCVLNLHPTLSPFTAG